MKNLLLCLTVFLLSFTAFAQQNSDMKSTYFEVRKYYANDGKLQDNMPQVTRREKWLMALDCSRFGDLAENIMEQCKICRTDIATQINALLKTLNGIVHNPLCNVIDPTTTTCLVINKLVVGEMQARLLECIAIKCQINSVVIPQVP